MTDEELSAIIVTAICAAVDTLSSVIEFSDPGFEHGSSITDLAELSRGRDCYYDRPTIGLHYALWYHPQRSADLVRVLTPIIVARGSSGQQLDIVDLGAGTGATATAVRIVLERLRRVGAPTPKVRIEALESSPFMIDMLHAIDSEVSKRLPPAQLEITTHQRSWFSPKVSKETIELNEPHMVASYTFDHSDRDLNATLVRRLRDMADRVGAQTLHLLGPLPKSDILQEVADRLNDERPESSAWEPWDVGVGDFNPTASLEPLAEMRRQLSDGHGAVLPLLRQAPDWSNRWLWTRSLRRAPTQLFPPEPLHYGFALDETQEAAANPAHEATPRPTAIVGAAGSGKSYVLMERAARILERHPAQRILITAFNVAMIDELAAILQRRMPELDLARQTQEGGLWCDSAHGGHLHASRIVLCNRDKLPTRIFGMSFDADPVGLAREVSAEAERFIWGKCQFQWDDYKDHVRTGVGRGNQLLGPQRRELWDSFWKDGTNSFTHRRIATLKNVRQEAVPVGQRFNHVLVDECQDFTEADFELLRHLLDDPSDLSVAGDEAQSLHLGGTYKRPTLNRADGSTTVWKVHRLEGAYRLPVASCRAVSPLAAFVRLRVSGSGGSVEDLTIPEPRKAASYGPRPIVLVQADLQQELPRVLQFYRRIAGTDDVCVTDGAWQLRNPVVQVARRAGFRIEKANMRRIKGLERPLVIVLAQSSGNHDEETAAQCFYTAMTRATAVSVLVLPDQPCDDLRDVLKALRPEAFLPWNSRSASAMKAAFAS